MRLATKHHVFHVRHFGGYRRTAHVPWPAVSAPAGNRTRAGVGRAGVVLRRRDVSARAARRPAPASRARGCRLSSPPGYLCHRKAEGTMREGRKGWKKLRGTCEPVPLVFLPAGPKCRNLEYQGAFVLLLRRGPPPFRNVGTEDSNDRQSQKVGGLP